MKIFTFIYIFLNSNFLLQKMFNLIIIINKSSKFFFIKKIMRKNLFKKTDFFYKFLKIQTFQCKLLMN